MKAALLVLTLALLRQSMALSMKTRINLEPLSDDMINYINNLGTTWKAGHNDYFRGKSMDSIRRLMGFVENPSTKLPVVTNDHIPSNDVPDSFDSRQQWPDCPTIPDIRDQSNCGSCWAVAAAAAMSDRICIASNAKQTTRISDENLLSCCTACGNGCGGGNIADAWNYFVRTGIVTGGNYTVHDGCQPYPFAPCEHHSAQGSGSYPSCPSEEQSTPACQHTCQDGYTTPYDQDKHQGTKAYSLKNDEEAIKKEILANGPVEAGFTVYEDFLSYTSGIYQHVTGKRQGGHAVKILGWGSENGTPYWLIANSWNSDWGENGYFRMLRGKDECGIEKNVVAGLAKVQ